MGKDGIELTALVALLRRRAPVFNFARDQVFFGLDRLIE